MLIALLHPPAGTGLPICPSRLFSSVPCPGCGLTRSVSCAVRADFSRSWHYHPFGVVFLAVVLVIAAVGVLPAGPRHAAWSWAQRRSRVLSVAAAVYLVLLIAWGTARMLGLVGHPI